MRLVIFNGPDESALSARLGVLVAGGRLVADLRAGYARQLHEARHPRAEALAAALMPPRLAQVLAAGAAGQAALREAVPYLEALAGFDAAAAGLRGEPLFRPLERRRLQAPLQPRKIIAVGRNYASHVTALGSEVLRVVPSAWIKAGSTVTGPADDIVRPACTRELDYETELAVVISQRCKDVPASRAYEVVAGYMVVNDISARDVARLERAQGNHLLDKMFDGFAPMGPWLVTRDEVEDPMSLRIVTRVNGEVRQDGSTRQMVWSIPDLIAYLSQMTLEPGDVILTGTPDGTAVERKAGEPPGFLNPGDVLESEIESVGTLTNRIVEDPQTEGSWRW